MPCTQRRSRSIERCKHGMLSLTNILAERMTARTNSGIPKIYPMSNKIVIKRVSC